MNNYHHPPSSSQHHSSLTHVLPHQDQQSFADRSYSLTRIPREQVYPPSPSYDQTSRYRQHMQGQDRRSNSPYHHSTMMNVPQVQQPPLQPPHPPMHDPNSRPPPPGVQYDFQPDYTPNAGPSDFHHPPPMYGRPDVGQVPQQGQPMPAPANHSSRPLNNSKRAEQNRKAQRAFRERRDQHVKQLESRSAMLDVALANADEANRRLEDSRILVEQLRAENQALRTALSAYVPQHGHPHSQLMIQAVPIPGLQLSSTQPAPPAGAAEAAPGQPTAQAQPQAPALDPSLPSQTQTSTQDSASAPLTSGVEGMALAYPADGQSAQHSDADRRSGTPAALPAGSPAPGPAGSDAPEGDKTDA
ncbi:bZIP transcription factor [Ceratobasidium sp. AG-Ba]|nr:bZIP transcription factor [Ceratobasidium sp. AG-Ba]